jgi:hypothetical protein
MRILASVCVVALLVVALAAGGCGSDFVDCGSEGGGCFGDADCCTGLFCPEDVCVHATLTALPS